MSSFHFKGFFELTKFFMESNSPLSPPAIQFLSKVYNNATNCRLNSTCAQRMHGGSSVRIMEHLAL